MNWVFASGGQRIGASADYCIDGGWWGGRNLEAITFSGILKQQKKCGCDDSF